MVTGCAPHLPEDDLAKLRQRLYGDRGQGRGSFNPLTCPSRTTAYKKRIPAITFPHPRHLSFSIYTSKESFHDYAQSPAL
jgi:hypothetical protein